MSTFNSAPMVKVVENGKRKKEEKSHNTQFRASSSHLRFRSNKLTSGNFTFFPSNLFFRSPADKCLDYTEHKNFRCRSVKMFEIIVRPII